MIQDRLENWRRYYADQRSLQCCGSLEGRYRSNWRQYAELHTIRLSVPPDPVDAEKVKNAWKSMLGKPKLMLKYHYFSGFPPNVVAYKVGFPPWKYKRELDRAEKIIEKILDRHEKEGYKVEDNLIRDRQIAAAHRKIGASSRPKESQADDMVWLFAF